MDCNQVPSSENTIPSSPTPAVFSDEPQRASSPPSSPPGFPWEKQTTSNDAITPLQKPPKSAFSILGKRKALEPIGENVRPVKKPTIPTTRPTGKSLSQMQISLGQEVQKKCKTCGMEYVPSSKEDRKLHDKYHKQNTEGYDVGKDFVPKARKSSTFPGAMSGDTICVVDCFDRPARKRRGQAVLEVVQRELGAVDIPEKEIWDFDRQDADVLPNGDPKYRAYLYVRESKCIGFLLVQKIRQAYRVVEPLGSDFPAQHVESREYNSTKSAATALKARREAEAEKLQWQSRQPIELSENLTPANLGISRIWTSPTHRRQNIATSLLDAALSDRNERAVRDELVRAEPRKTSDAFGVAGELEKQGRALGTLVQRVESKDAIAFSQPTEAGVRLARRWFGRMFGWSVYID